VREGAASQPRRLRRCRRFRGGCTRVDRFVRNWTGGRCVNLRRAHIGGGTALAASMRCGDCLACLQGAGK
jgi:hypothetical protein